MPEKLTKEDLEHLAKLCAPIVIALFNGTFDRVRESKLKTISNRKFYFEKAKSIAKKIKK